MAMIEVVGAVVDGQSVSTDAQEIEALRICGRQVEYIGRAEAIALGTRHREYRYLQDAPTLFVLDNGGVFRKRARLSHRANGAGDSRQVTDHAALARPARFATS